MFSKLHSAERNNDRNKGMPAPEFGMEIPCCMYQELIIRAYRLRIRAIHEAKFQ